MWLGLSIIGSCLMARRLFWRAYRRRSLEINEMVAQVAAEVEGEAPPSPGS